MKMILYVADDIQMMVGGKAVAMGLFMDKVVVLNIPEAMVAGVTRESAIGIPLSMAICLRDAPTDKVFGAEIVVLDPTGRQVATALSSEVSAPTGSAPTVLVKFNPLPLSMEGKYEVRVSALDQVMSDCVEFRFNPIAVPLVPRIEPGTKARAGTKSKSRKSAAA